MGLNAEQIQALYAKRRVKGQYEDLLVQLDTKSDEAGVNVREAWPILKDKNTSTLAQGFGNAVKKLNLGDKFDVISQDEQVYVMVKDRVALIDETIDLDAIPEEDDTDPTQVEAEELVTV